MSSLAVVTSPEHFEQFTAPLPPTALQVVYFHAPWAAPCATMSSVLTALASTYAPTAPPSIAFFSINAEDLPDLSEDFDVTAVPFIVLRKGTQVLETISGGDAARVRAAVEKHAGAGGANGTKTTLPPAQTVTRPAEQPTPAAAAPVEKSAPAPEAGKPAETKEQLWARLKDLTSAAPCMLFMKGTPSAPQCGFSRQLVGILREHSVRYGFFNILADEDVRQGLKEYADWPTFPQLWMQGELVGGLDIVREEIENDADFFGEVSVKKAVAA